MEDNGKKVAGFVVTVALTAGLFTAPAIGAMRIEGFLGGPTGTVEPVEDRAFDGFMVFEQMMTDSGAAVMLRPGSALVAFSEVQQPPQEIILYD